MKLQTMQRHAERIDRAVQLLAERLRHDAAPSLDELAEAAALSSFHFHRVFRLMTGETVNEAVRRIRLARGTAALGEASVTVAAGEAAYATSQAFARSMRAFAGMSAREVARHPDAAALFAAPTRSPLSIELVSLDPLQVIAIRNIGDHAQLDALFGRLFEIAGGPEAVEGIYGLYLGDPRFDPPESCAFEGALRLAATPAVLGEARAATIGGGRYLRLRHQGDYDAIPLALDELTLAALADHGIELRDAPPLVHYLDDPEETPVEALRSDVHLPVAPRTGA